MSCPLLKSSFKATEYSGKTMRGMLTCKFRSELCRNEMCVEGLREQIFQAEWHACHKRISV